MSRQEWENEAGGHNPSKGQLQIREGSFAAPAGSACLEKGCIYDRAIRTGRATWICPECRQDISLTYVLWWEAVHPREEMPTS